MILVVALLAACDQFDDAAAKIRFPEPEKLLGWTEKSETDRKIVRLITDRGGWSKAFRTIQDKLGLFPAKVDIKIVVEDSDDSHPAWSRGNSGRGTIWFNMRRLVPYQKKLDEIDAEMREGKLSAWILPPTRPEGVLTHELTHVICGAMEERWLSEGIATYAAGDESYLYSFNKAGGRVATLNPELAESDCYPRGMVFFRWMEAQFGAGKLKEFVGRVADGREGAAPAAADVFRSTWEDLLRQEKDWSTEYLTKFKTAR